MWKFHVGPGRVENSTCYNRAAGHPQDSADIFAHNLFGGARRVQVHIPQMQGFDFHGLVKHLLLNDAFKLAFGDLNFLPR